MGQTVERNLSVLPVDVGFYPTKINQSSFFRRSRFVTM